MRSTHSCHLLLTRKKMRTCSRKRQIMKEFTKDAKNLRFCWKKKKELILVKMTKKHPFFCQTVLFVYSGRHRFTVEFVFLCVCRRQSRQIFGSLAAQRWWVRFRKYCNAQSLVIISTILKKVTGSAVSFGPLRKVVFSKCAAGISKIFFAK